MKTPMTKYKFSPAKQMSELVGRNKKKGMRTSLTIILTAASLPSDGRGSHQPVARH